MDPSTNTTQEGNNTPGINIITPTRHTNTETSGNENGDAETNAPPTPSVEHGRAVEDFSADLKEYRQQEDFALAMMMGTMSGMGSNRPMPTLQTEKWKFTGKTPNPISIRRARRFLAAAYEMITCEEVGTGAHGYAWIAETPEQWAARSGTAPIAVPEKPEDTQVMDLQAEFFRQRKMQKYLLYIHLIQAGTEKLVAWFGKSMFLDLHTNGVLRADATPKELLEHLEGTYSNNADELEYLEVITKDFNTPYDPKRPVEEYFMRLQETRADSIDLKVPYSEQQVIMQALGQFVKVHGKDGRKAAKKWHNETRKTWETFKTFWKREIHEWNRVGSGTKQALAVEQLTSEMGSIRASVHALEAENQNYRDRNNDLEYALNVEKARHGTQQDDDSTISTITEAMGLLMDRKLAAFNANLSGSSNTTITEDSTQSADRRNKLKVAKNRRPDAYKNLNGGRGKQFMFYCWHPDCGVNTNHNTDRCYALTDEQKTKYKNATFVNRMGGSEKNIDRFGRFQRDYNFDSL